MICELCGLTILPEERSRTQGHRHATPNLCVLRLHALLAQAQAERLASERQRAEEWRRSEAYRLVLRAIQDKGADYTECVSANVRRWVNEALAHHPPANCPLV